MALTSLKPLKSCPGATGEGGRRRGGSAGRAESAGGGLRGVYKGGGRGPGAGGRGELFLPPTGERVSTVKKGAPSESVLEKELLKRGPP